MDLSFLLGLLHILMLLAWAVSALVLGLILLAARRDDPAALRAVREAATVDRRALRPVMLGALVTGAALAGLSAEVWALLSALLVTAALGLGRVALQPASARALRWGGAAALVEGRRALRLAGLSLGMQVPALVLLVLQPGWGGVAILGGLMACLALAGGLMAALGGDGTARAI